MKKKKKKNHERDTAVNEITERMRQIISNRHNKACCFGKEIFFGSVSAENRIMELSFLTEASVIAIMRLKKGFYQNDTIRLAM